MRYLVLFFVSFVISCGQPDPYTEESYESTHPAMHCTAAQTVRNKLKKQKIDQKFDLTCRQIGEHECIKSTFNGNIKYTFRQRNKLFQDWCYNYEFIVDKENITTDITVYN